MAPDPAMTRLSTRGTRKSGAVAHAPQPSKPLAYTSIATRDAIGIQNDRARPRDGERSLIGRGGLWSAVVVQRSAEPTCARTLVRGVLPPLEVPSEIGSDEFEYPVDLLPAIRGPRRSQRVRPT